MNSIKHTKILGLALAVALLVSGLGVASASATPLFQWYLNGSPVKEAVPVTIKGNIRVYIGNNVEPEFEFKCSVTNKGTVAPEGKGTITESTLTSCTGGGGLSCPEFNPAVKTKNLPWHSVPLNWFEPEKTDEIYAPEWSWECHWFGMRREGFCQGTEYGRLTNTTEAGVKVVNESFNIGKAPSVVHCGGSYPGVGAMEGEDHVKATGGGNLEIK